MAPDQTREIPDTIEQITILAAPGAQCYEIGGEGPEEFGAFVRAEIIKWGRVIKESNIKLE